MISTIVSRLVILVFGTLYPAYASYKAVRTKNVKEYVKWMMYWIVFALFTCAETFTDVFLSWFPFYYEIKIILVLWLLSPATKGSSILYRKFVHPMLSRREQEIDDYIAKAKEQGYHTVLNLGTKGVNYATTVIMQTAIKGGGGIVNQLRKSYSLSDLTDDTDSRADIRGLQEAEQTDVVDPRHVRRRHSPRRSSSGSSRMDMYFPEVDIRPGPPLSHVRSTEDVSSGYSSAEPLYVGQPPKLEPREGLVRTASVGGASRPRTRTTRASLSTKKSSPLPEDSEGSESDSDITIIQKISKTTQKIKRTIILHEETDSSDENVEFEDTIGFPIENNPIKIEKILGNISETSQTIIEPQMTQNFEAETKIETVIEVQIEKQSSVDDFEESNENIQTEKILDNISKTSQTIIEPQITQNFEAETKIETVIEVQIEKQASVDDFEESNENLPTDDDEITEDTSTGSITTVLEVQIGKGPSINIFEDTNEANIVEEKLDQRINDKNENNDEQIIGIVEECQKNEIVNEELQKSEENAKKIEIVAEESNSNIDLETETISSQRRGKYNKMTAPVPPTNENKEIASKIEEINMENSETVSEISESVCDRKMAEKSHEISLKVEEKSNLTEVPTSESESHPIKATLVLKPGVIKNIGSEESPNSSIFFSQSPKPKHKTKKHENPISRLMMLPKKIFGSKESSSESLKEKRKSLNLDSKSLTPSVEDLKSKSDTEDLYEPVEYFGDKKSVSAANIADKKFEDNKMILRNLSHSPKQYRRKVKKGNYDYEDSD